MITSFAVAIAASILPILANDPEVGDDPVFGDIIVWDENRTAPRDDDAPIKYNPDNPAAPPTEHIPEPLVCRIEAPFPQGDDCVMPTDPVETETPEVTPGDVERAVRRVGLPRLTAQVQPAGTTLVNLETIFHTSAVPFERTVPILDSTVDLRAEPASYVWNHGDATSQTTSLPGRPYPAMDVIHRYQSPAQRVSTSVDVTYRVTYRIDGGAWQDLAATITAPGPATVLRVREARPVLTRD